MTINTHITHCLNDFNKLYRVAKNVANPQSLQMAIQKMTELKEQINLALNPPSEFSKNLQLQIEEITHRYESLSSPKTKTEANAKISPPAVFTTTNNNSLIPVETTKTTAIGSKHISKPVIISTESSQAVREASDLAVGFENMSANCWANSLLSLAVFIPSLRTAYETVADSYSNDTANKPHADNLKAALMAYDMALAEGKPIPAIVSQKVRLAFHHLFQNEVQGISAQSYHQEDASEAMQLIMGRYEEILKKQGKFDPAPELYCPLETTRYYDPIGEAVDVDLLDPDYFPLEENDCSASTSSDYQIILDLQGRNLSFPALLSEFFYNTSILGSEPATYLNVEGRKQEYALICEERKFKDTPKELFLTIKRFGITNLGVGYKITTPVAVNRMISLPAEATTSNQSLAYELDAFIVHYGAGFGSGHYISYKKIDGRWIEANDAKVRFVSEQEIDQILQGNKAMNCTSYIHHYALVPEPQQQRANAVASSMASAKHVVTDWNALEVKKYADEKQACERAIAALKKYAVECRDPSKSPVLLQYMETQAFAVLQQLQFAVGLENNFPHDKNSGLNALKANPAIPFEIKTPWLYPANTLFQQVLEAQKIKLVIVDQELTLAHLTALSDKISDSSVTSYELKKALSALPASLQETLYELVNQAHQLRFGKFDDPAYQGAYGKKMLESDVRKVLTEAMETVLNTRGNILEQLIAQQRAETDKITSLYYKNQLEAFHGLLLNGSLTKNQLVEAFEHLDINPDLKQNLYLVIALHYNKSEVPGFGMQKFFKNPHCLLKITEGYIANPPICKVGANVLMQMIASLDNASK